MTRHKTQRLRQGTVIYEAVIAIMLATAVIVGVTEVMVVVAKQRREVARRTTARREAGNLMEEMMTRNWDQLVVDAETELALSEGAKRQLPAANGTMHVAAVDDDTAAKRVSIRIAWGEQRNVDRQSLLLVTWRYRPEERQP